MSLEAKGKQASWCLAKKGLFISCTQGGYTREMGTICPFGVFFCFNLSLQNWPFSFQT